MEKCFLGEETPLEQRQIEDDLQKSSDNIQFEI